MRNVEFDSRRIKLAQYRYFNLERSASEIPEEKAYVILAEFNGTYINVLNPLEELPVLGRTPYPNVTSDGRHEFGNMLYLVSGTLQDGPCYVLERTDMAYAFHKEKVVMKDIENFVLNSDYFFIDRIKLLEGKKRAPKSLYNKRLLLEDTQRLFRFNEYLSSHDSEKKLEKK